MCIIYLTNVFLIRFLGALFVLLAEILNFYIIKLLYLCIHEFFFFYLWECKSVRVGVIKKVVGIQFSKEITFKL